MSVLYCIVGASRKSRNPKGQNWQSNPFMRERRTWGRAGNMKPLP